MSDLHVVPDERTTTWRVYETDADTPLSEHASATEAEFAAQAWAVRRNAERVIVHDRYHRTHEPTGSLTTLRERTRAARARELASVRDRIQRLPGTPAR